MKRTFARAAAAALLISAGCGGGGGGGDAPVEFAEPVANPEAAARAFRLFYKERADRAATAYNRFALFGDSVAATTNGRADAAKSGNAYEVIPGPRDNNLIGTAIYGAWHAYKHLRTRTLALTLVRMFEGVAMFEAVPGVPGLTSREVLPGWTRVMDGPGGRVSRARGGLPFATPFPPDPALEREVLETFYKDVVFTYREDPSEYFFAYLPVADTGAYAVTYGFSDLPRFLRVSDCCSSFMRVPEGLPWAGAFWGNHNSRDNFPDLSLGVLAAMEAMDDPAADPEVRASARRAFEAGRRIGDLVQANGGRIMTIDEFSPYGTLTVSGGRRPHGDPENQDLGSMASCPMAYLARAISSEGLDLPYPALPLPAELEQFLLQDLLGIEIDLPIYDCLDIGQAYFGADFGNLFRTEPLGLNLLALLELLDEANPGTAQQFIGSFQDDYDDIVESTTAVIYYAQIAGKPALEASARAALRDQTNLQRDFADVIFSRIDPARRARQRYDAALFDAIGGLSPLEEDLGGFAIAEERVARAESRLALADTAPRPLRTDGDILAQVEGELAGESVQSVVDRYRAAYGMTPPVRRTAEGYEARTAADPTFRPVENPRHVAAGDLRLFEEIRLCTTAPALLDCAWAALGCDRADLSGDGASNEADAARFEDAFSRYSGLPENACVPRNGWCEGADLDRTGEVDALDRAFLAAAAGCRV